MKDSLFSTMKTLSNLPLPPAASSPRRRSFWAAWLLPLLLGGLPTAHATDVEFSDGKYVINGNEVTMSMYGITNHNSNTSGTLRMELWAYPSPYTGSPGSVSTAYRLAVSSTLGQLDGDSSFTGDPVTTTAFLFPAPKGTYYLTLFIAEYENGSYDDGFETDGYVDFSASNTFAAVGGVDFGVTSAVQVGSGYFYDSDLGYLYPFFGTGWMYSSDLDRYFYVDLGTDFISGVYIYDLSRGSWTYTERSFWPYVYYFDGTGWVDTGFN